MRAFSIGQWHHFAYLVISIALLGFGASCTLLAAIERRRLDTAKSLHSFNAGWFAISATLFAVALPVSFWLTQRVPFDSVSDRLGSAANPVPGMLLPHFVRSIFRCRDRRRPRAYQRIREVSPAFMPITRPVQVQAHF